MAVSMTRPAVGKRRPAAATATSTGVRINVAPKFATGTGLPFRPNLYYGPASGAPVSSTGERIACIGGMTFASLWRFMAGPSACQAAQQPNQVRALLIGKAIMDLPARAHVYMRRRHGRGSAAPASMRLVTRCGWAACWVLSAVLREVAAKYYALMTIR